MSDPTRSVEVVIAEAIAKWRALKPIEPFGLPHSMYVRAKHECANELEPLVADLVSARRRQQELQAALLSALRVVTEDRHACGTMKRRALAAIAKAEALPGQTAPSRE